MTQILSPQRKESGISNINNIIHKLYLEIKNLFMKERKIMSNLSRR